MILESGYRAEQVVVIGHQLQVDVDRRLAPAKQDRGDTAREVNARLGGRGSAESAHEPREGFAIRQPAHAAARSKLTSRRIKALYRECAVSTSSAARR